VCPDCGGTTDAQGHERHDLPVVARIGHCVTSYNATATPFTWTATADSILAKVERLAKLIGGTRP
jgi:hypothetical protein